MTVEHDTSVRDSSLSRLLIQYQDKPRIESFIGVHLDQAQDIEDALWQLRSERAVSTASGQQLDKLGELLVQPRFGLADDQYRLILKARILVLQSSGTVDELIEILQVVLGEDVPLTWSPRYPAAHRLRVDEELGADPDIIMSLLHAAKAGGVRTLLEYTLWPLADTFQLSADSSVTDADLGLAGEAQTAGGHYSGALASPGDVLTRIDGMGVLHDCRTGHIITDPSSEPDIVRSLDATWEGWHLEQSASSRRPALLTSPSSFAASRAYHFDGTEYMQHSDKLNLGTEHFALFAVIATGSSALQFIWETIGSGSAGVQLATSSGNAAVVIQDASGNSVAVVSGAVDDGNAHMIEAHYDPTTQTVELFVDRISQGTDTNFDLDGSAIDSADALTFGARADGTDIFTGQIAAAGVIARDTAVTEDERTRLRDSLGGLMQ